MKQVLLVTIFLLSLAPLSAQQPDSSKVSTRGVIPLSPSAAATPKNTITRAVVVGISQYQNPDIPKLKYADKDAQAFANWLRSPGGGSLDKDHLTVLLNDQATNGKIISALYGLIEDSKDGDVDVIYFSGHGDVEAIIRSQPGFLLTYDSPAKVYMGGALNLRDLQDILSTLTDKKVQVIMVSDACHSGTLAGSAIGGPQATSAALSKFTNEVLVLSCQPDEFSLEGEQWGGGRGLFSYYLVNGLYGLADNNADSQVSLFELGRYLEDWVPKNAEKLHQSQFPVISGNKSTRLATVDPAMALALQSGEDPSTPSGSIAANNTKGMPPAPEAALDPSTLAQYNQFKDALKKGQLLYPEEHSAWALFNQLKGKIVIHPFQGLMKRDLAAALQDSAQQAINDYLKADPAELRKRWSYDPRYEHFPEYLEKAAELYGDDSPVYKTLKAREHYFRGLNYRLRGERTKTPTLYNLALSEQALSLELEPNAAYTYNELGLLDRRLRKYKESIGHFEEAVARSPAWVLPWANLCSSYLELKSFSDAEIAGKQAVRLDSTFVLSLYMLGSTYQFLSQFGKAKELYKKAVFYEPDYADAYSNLGMIAYKEKDYAEAEKMWETTVRLIPDVPYMITNLGEVHLLLGKKDEALACFQQALVIDPNFYEANNSLGDFYLTEGKYPEAETALRRCVELRPKSPDAFYRLACALALQQQPEKALDELGKALANGYSDFKTLEEDPRLASIRTEARFAELLKRYKK